MCGGGAGSYEAGVKGEDIKQYIQEGKGVFGVC